MNDKVYILVSVLNMLFWLISNIATTIFITWKLSSIYFLAWVLFIPIGIAIWPLFWAGYCKTDDFIDREANRET